MKPFIELVRDRCADPQKAAAEAVARLERWQFLSSSQKVSLDEIAWFGAVFALAGVHAESITNQIEKKVEGNVTTVIAGDGVGARDFV